MSADWILYWTSIVLSIGGYLLTALAIPRILMRRREPGATLAWLIVIIAVPYLGLLLYWIFGVNRIKRQCERKSRTDLEIASRLQPLRHILPPAPEPFQRMQTYRHLQALSKTLSIPEPTGGNHIELSTQGERSFDALLGAIESARHHIHMEYYVWHPDDIGTKVRDALVKAAQRGVQVRVLYDAIGSYKLVWNPGFFDPLRGVGGRVGTFMPFFYQGSASVVNLRNHRKITIVDGRQALTGGINIANEYAGLDHRLGRWRDTQILLRGPAVEQLQTVFLSDWAYITGEPVDDRAFFPQPDTGGAHMVQVIPSGPDASVASLHRLLFSIITRAQQRIYMTTPYFVPDAALSTAIRTVAMSGVAVDLLLPSQGNHRLVDWAGKSFYSEFLEAGVDLYEFEKGLLHAKALTVDGLWSVVGSANMDIRSFRLNFEINTVIYGEKFAAELEAAFVQDVTASRRVTPEQVAAWSGPRRFAHTAARVLSPVL